jgi:hypothetical protein
MSTHPDALDEQSDKEGQRDRYQNQRGLDVVRFLVISHI